MSKFKECDDVGRSLAQDQKRESDPWQLARYNAIPIGCGKSVMAAPHGSSEPSSLK